MDGDETVLVTGGSGFLGGWCLVELLRGGYRARTTVRDLGRERAVRANVGSQVEVGDRLEVLAAELIVPARDGTLRVLRESLAAGVKRIVLTSSVAAVRNARPGVGSDGRQLT